MVEIYCDAATLADIERFADDHAVQGFTTNPSLMRKAGITKYCDFADAVLARVQGKPVSFEVLADDFNTMEKQAREIASWGKNVWVKIPVTNTKGESSMPLVRALGDVNINLTAVMTLSQILVAQQELKADDILSIFIGRITDTGVSADEILPFRPKHWPCRILWASTREVYNYYQAEQSGVDIITMTPDLIAKLSLLRGKNLDRYSLETVRMFHEDGKGIEL